MERAGAIVATAASRAESPSLDLELTQRWRYRAATPAGAFKRGFVLATSHDEARASIRQLGLMPLELRSEGSQRAQKLSIPVDQMALGLRILADLFEAGLPINRVLTTFEGLAPPAWRPALPSLHTSITEGRSFARALEDAPIAIPALVSGVIAAGEAGSGISTAVRRAAGLMEEAAATRAAVRGALTYPLLLAGAGIASIALLVGVVLPRFAEILDDLGQELPPATRLLIRASQLAQQAFVPLVLTLVVAIVAWSIWTQSEKGLRSWHAFMLGLPGLASLRLATASSRATTALAALITSGVPLRVALIHAARATGDAEIAARLLSVRGAIGRGQSLAEAVGQAKAMTPTAVRLIGAGESVGRLGEMLLHAGRIDREIADRTLRAWVRLLEPILVLTFAAIVGLVAAALLQAVYSVRPNA